MQSTPRFAASSSRRSPSGKEQDALLREGDELQVHDVADALAHLDHRVERRERRIGGVDVAPNVQDSVGHLPAEDLLHPLDDVVVGEGRLALGPALDALPERAALVPARFTRGEARVEMDVWLHVRWRDERTVHVELRLDGADADARRLDGEDLPRLDDDVDVTIRHVVIQQSRVPDNQLHHKLLRRPFIGNPPRGDEAGAPVCPVPQR